MSFLTHLERDTKVLWSLRRYSWLLTLCTGKLRFQGGTSSNILNDFSPWFIFIIKKGYYWRMQNVIIEEIGRINVTSPRLHSLRSHNGLYMKWVSSKTGYAVAEVCTSISVGLTWKLELIMPTHSFVIIKRSEVAINMLIMMIK